MKAIVVRHSPNYILAICHKFIFENSEKNEIKVLVEFDGKIRNYVQ